MALSEGTVQQQGRPLGTDNSSGGLYRNRGGQLEVNAVQGMIDAWTREGLVFSSEFTITQAATLTATIEANATVDLTEPFWRMAIPSGYIVVPIFVSVQSETVWVTADYILQWYSDTNTYSAGGASTTVRNLAHPASGISALNTSVCTVLDGDSALTESTLTNPVLFGAKAFVTGGLFEQYKYSIAAGDPVHYLRGAGAWGLTAKANAAHEVLYQVVWAELNKNEIFND